MIRFDSYFTDILVSTDNKTSLKKTCKSSLYFVEGNVCWSLGEDFYPPDLAWISWSQASKVDSQTQFDKSF